MHDSFSDMSDILALFERPDFFDRFSDSGDTTEAMDVVIPLLHSNDLWESNLLSYYREIPIRRLIIGNAGAIDGSLETLKRFPRVTVLDQTKIKTLGACLAELISIVESEHFVYLQSDVFLPNGWFNSMSDHKGQYEWFGCRERNTVLVQFEVDYSESRPSLPGAQMGARIAFDGIAKRMADDYVYRQEDFVLSSVVLQNGGRVGQNLSTFHVHEFMTRATAGEKNQVRSVTIHKEENPDEVERVFSTQVWGFIKYCNPEDPGVSYAAAAAAFAVIDAGYSNWKALIAFAAKENALWVPYLKIQRRQSFYRLLKKILKRRLG